MDNAIPFAALACLIAAIELAGLNFFAIDALFDLARQLAEFGLIALGLAIVMMSGGIDLSVGSVFALSALATLICINVYEQSVFVAFLTAMAVGGLCGAINGVLIGYSRIRAFLTTLVTLIIYRSIYELVFAKFSTAIMATMADSPTWDFLGYGTLFAVPVSFGIALIIAIGWHVVLSRMRFGWRLQAVGGARRSAFNAGIDVSLTIFSAYTASGLLCAVAGFLMAARLGSTGTDTGVGLEVQALTAVVLGGISLGGGRGSVSKASMGAIFVLVLTNGLISLGVTGPTASLILGLVLITAVYLDVRWLKNREKLLRSVYISPAYAQLPDLAKSRSDLGRTFEINDRLRSVEVIGLGEIESPEDVILDDNDDLYCGTRNGDIIRFFAPDYKRQELFAHIGGQPLGLAFDRIGNLIVCVAGMGLYQVAQDRIVSKLTDETNRSLTSIVDDSQLRLADDLDIAPDGRIFFSEATVRYGMHDWPVDALESRGNGRIICYDPTKGTTRTEIRGLIFPNGVCMCEDGQSFIYAETWACRITRYWFDGPKKGKSESVVENLPGYPDNINRASDGGFWLALVGMRSPALDLALRMPGFRRRMARQVARDNWIFPNINTGCIVKFTPQGEVVETLWDLGGINHPMVTSMREHKGCLFIGGISNNRIGRYTLERGRSDWTGMSSYWGRK
ncbi:ABC transporter permease [Mesorhizobium argentiipisi]